MSGPLGRVRFPKAHRLYPMGVSFLPDSTGCFDCQFHPEFFSQVLSPKEYKTPGSLVLMGRLGIWAKNWTIRRRFFIRSFRIKGFATNSLAFAGVAGGIFHRDGAEGNGKDTSMMNAIQPR